MNLRKKTGKTNQAKDIVVKIILLSSIELELKAKYIVDEIIKRIRERRKNFCSAKKFF